MSLSVNVIKPLQIKMKRRRSSQISKPNPIAEFIFAAKSGNLKSVRAYLQEGIDPNCTWDDTNALHIAVELGNVNLLLLLTNDKNLLIDKIIRQGNTPLIIACTDIINPKIISILLKQGANPNIQNNFGKTALHYAVLNNSILIAKKLISYGAVVNVLDEFGNSPLSVACLDKQYLPMAKFLLKHEANPNILIPFSLPLFLDVCLHANKDNMDFVNLLMDYDVDFTVQESASKKDALHFASHTCNPALAKLLIGHLDPLRKDASGRNALMIAKQHGCPEVLVIYSDYLVATQLSNEKKKETNKHK